MAPTMFIAELEHPRFGDFDLTACAPLVIRGGENVDPREVEEFCYQHPAVGDVQVVGVPDQRYGQELCAWVRLREGQQVPGDELRE